MNLRRINQPPYLHLRALLPSICFLRQHWPALLGGLAAAAALLLPLNLLALLPFHHDEALYATWALKISSGLDPWLKETPIDKPPLFLYLLAGVMVLLGVTETAARTPSLLATALTVLLTFWLGRRFYSNGVAVLAAWLAALSPFSLLFAPTAFTDPFLVTLVLAGSLAAAAARPIPAGLCLALATAAKQQGLFFIPLILGLLWLALPKTSPQVMYRNYLSNTRYFLPRHILGYFTTPGVSPGACPERSRRGRSDRLDKFLRFTFYTLRFILAFCLTLLPFLLWDFSRSQPSAFLEESLKNYGGLVPDAAGFIERWWGFVDLLQYGTASPLLNKIFLTGLPLLLLYPVVVASLQRSGAKRAESASPTTPAGMDQPETAKTTLSFQVDWLLALFCLGFLLLHALLSFQVWDRYLLGLIPILALLLARILFLPRLILADGTRFLFQKGISGPWPVVSGHILRGIYGIALALLLSFSLAGPVQDAIQARYPLGSHSQALYGIDQIVGYLQGHTGANHTLYHHWLGTHWRFYLWAYPYDLQYWATAEALAARARPGHFIAFPGWQSETEARLALFQAGLGLQELVRAYRPDGTPSVILYRIETLPE